MDDVTPNEVVPHVGTWIEIVESSDGGVLAAVVPHVGTWIEMVLPLTHHPMRWSCLT